MQLVYICSPYKAYDNVTVADNLKKAKKYCKMASDKGFIPICPHLYFTQFLNDDCENERNAGIDMGLSLLRRCKEVWVFGDYISEGMSAETAYAITIRAPIKFFNENCDEVIYRD